MARSLGMTAYLARARRLPQQLKAPQTPRPPGELLWLHAGSEAQARALVALGQRLQQQRDGTHVITTRMPGGDTHLQGAFQDLPGENPGDVERFLDHWRPDLCFWAANSLRPALLDLARSRGTALFLLDADEGDWETRRWSLLREPTREALQLFDLIFARNDKAATRLARHGVAPERILASGPLVEDCIPPPCDPDTLEEVTLAVANRPLWLAALIEEAELDAVIEAHRGAIRLSHRQLLILMPATPAGTAKAREMCQKAGWRVAQWGAGEMPDEATQVLLVDRETGPGLWYRLAPVTFLGGSLVAGHDGVNPLEAAALGSAVLYGPHVGRHAAPHARLARAGAIRSVDDAASLTAALADLSAPDRLAAMAHAGWEVISEGAEVADQIITEAQDRLDAAVAA